VPECPLFEGGWAVAELTPLSAGYQPRRRRTPTVTWNRVRPASRAQTL
jgi:hypothetical protein